MRRTHSIASTGLLLILGLGQARGENGIDPEAQTYDCGTMALYHLLRLEGRSTDLATIERLLSVSRKGRFSMSDLRNAALAWGIHLEGVHLPKTDKAPSALALVYLDRRPDGHFVLVRPVGFTGKLVQVIDSVHEPFVMDALSLYASPEWTGLALVPIRSNRFVRAGGLATIVVGISLILTGSIRAWVNRSRFRSPGRSSWTRA